MGSEDAKVLLQVKDELIYCAANCVLVVHNSNVLSTYSHDLMKQAVLQGSLRIIIQGLDFKSAQTQDLGIKVALTGLFQYFKHFKPTHSFTWFKEHQFEDELNGLDILENCQYHKSKSVYKLSHKILTKFFELEPP